MTPPTLFPPAAEREHIDDYLTRELLGAQARIAAGPTTATLDPARFERELAEFDFQGSQPLPELLKWAVGVLEHGVVHPTHPRYFGLYNPAPTFAAQCADRIVSALNPQLASATTSPAAVALEAHVIRALASRLGFPAHSGGHFTSGGSESNFTALLCALTRKDSRYASFGSRAFDGAPVFYTSRECHLSWVKIAHQAGIGREAVRLVATDGRGRMSIPALESSIEGDLAEGRIPVMVVATAGTTSAGVIDPLQECADVAGRQNLWYHVDAAWAGAALVSDRLRSAITGIASADSITMDAHKWLATTMGCGMFLIRQPSVLSTVFGIAATYMPSRELSRDPYMNSVQWSRRFLGLRLFLALACVGWRGYADHVERAVSQAARIAQRLCALGWHVLNDSPVAVLAVTPPPELGDPRVIVRRVLESGRAWVSIAQFESRDVIRICVTNGETSDEDISCLIKALNAREPGI